MPRRVGRDVRLLTTSEVARLLRVSPQIVDTWIEQQKVPYVELPGGEYRIPLAGLLGSLNRSFDLGRALAEIETAFADVSEEEIEAALGD